MIIGYQFKTYEKLKIKIRDKDESEFFILSSDNDYDLCFNPFNYIDKDNIYVEIFQPKLKSKQV